MPHPFFGAIKKTFVTLKKRWPNKELFLARQLVVEVGKHAHNTVYHLSTRSLAHAP